VFYVQYAHARIASIFRNQAGPGGGALDDAGADLERLALPEEIGLVKRAAAYPDVLAACARGLEPHPLAQYLVGLAAAFHGYYNRVRVISDDEGASRARLALARGVGIVLRNGLDLMGIAAAEQM
jgi:arginyl-tRNA synthetase